MKFSKNAKYPTKYGVFNVVAAKSESGRDHVVMWVGDVQQDDAIIRIQSACITSTALGGVLCDCAEQVQNALERIQSAGNGVFLYLDEEGRGLGLLEKVNTMKEMNEGADTVTAFTKRGLPADVRDYVDVEPILKHLSVSSNLICLTNNPNKVRALEDYGYTVAREPIEIKPTSWTREYLAIKRDKLGHIISLTEVE